jgi:hypothetical protein
MGWFEAWRTSLVAAMAAVPALAAQRMAQQKEE